MSNVFSGRDKTFSYGGVQTTSLTKLRKIVNGKGRVTREFPRSKRGCQEKQA